MNKFRQNSICKGKNVFSYSSKSEMFFLKFNSRQPEEKVKTKNFLKLKIKISIERRRKNRKKRKDQKITAENQEKKKRKRRRGRSQRRNAKILSTFRKWRVSRYVRKLIKQKGTYVQTQIIQHTYVQTQIRQHTYVHSAHVCTDTNI